jgi:hypothetical protein
MKGVMDVNRNMLRNIISILRESPLYSTLPRHEKRLLIGGLAENYLFLGEGESEEIVGYESSWAAIIETEGK